MALSQYDQSVRDAGYKYVPQSQYLLDPFQIPQGSENEVPTGIATTYQAQNMGGGGGGFNPYSPDMNQIRTDFDPTAYNLAMRNEEKFGPTVGPNPDMYFTPQSQFQKALGTAINFIPGIGTIKRGAEFLGNTLERFMPVNERAIMENEARGMGIFTDDIGRVVAGPDGYNTAQGIMAGYNLNKIDQGTFDKRRATIEKAIERRKASGQDYSGLTEKLGLLDEAEDLYLGPLKTRTDTIYKYRKDKKAAEKDRKLQEEIDAYNKAQAERVRLERLGRDKDRGGFDPSGPTQASIRASREDKSGRGQSGGFTNPGKGSYGPHMADGGRVAYMMGGLTDLVDIYD
jgi:hypothetical protein